MMSVFDTEIIFLEQCCCKPLELRLDLVWRGRYAVITDTDKVFSWFPISMTGLKGSKDERHHNSDVISRTHTFGWQYLTIYSSCSMVVFRWVGSGPPNLYIGRELTNVGSSRNTCRKIPEQKRPDLPFYVPWSQLSATYWASRNTEKCRVVLGRSGPSRSCTLQALQPAAIARTQRKTVGVEGSLARDRCPEAWYAYLASALTAMTVWTTFFKYYLSMRRLRDSSAIGVYLCERATSRQLNGTSLTKYIFNVRLLRALI